MVQIIIFSGAPISKRSTVKSDYQSDDFALAFLCALVSVIRKYHWIKVGSERGRRFKGPDINIYRDTCVTVVMAYVMLLVINWQYYILAPFPISLVTFITYLQNEINGSKDTLSEKKSGSKDTVSARKKVGSKDKDRKKSDELVGAPTHPSRSNDKIKIMDRDDNTKIGELERTVAIPYYILLICAIYGDGNPALSHFLLFLCYALGTLAIMYSRLANNGVNPLKQALECIQMAYLVMLFITVHTVAAEWLGEVTALVCVPELISGFVWFSSLLHGGSSNSAADKVDTNDSGLLFVPLGAVLACLTCTYGYHYEGEFLASWWYTEATVSCAVAGCMPYLSLWMISRWPGSLPRSEKATQMLMFPANICLTGACLMLFALLVENTLAYGLFGLDGHINPAVLKYLYFSTAVACLVPLYVKRVLLHVDYALELPASL